MILAFLPETVLRISKWPFHTRRLYKTQLIFCNYYQRRFILVTKFTLFYYMIYFLIYVMSRKPLDALKNCSSSKKKTCFTLWIVFRLSVSVFENKNARVKTLLHKRNCVVCICQWFEHNVKKTLWKHLYSHIYNLKISFKFKTFVHISLRHWPNVNTVYTYSCIQISPQIKNTSFFIEIGKKKPIYDYS